MIGPVERQVRELLVEGATRDQVACEFGGYGLVFFDRLVRRRIATVDAEGRARLNARLLPASAAAIAETRRRREAEAAARAAAGEAARRQIEQREVERRRLAAQLGRARTPEERRRIARESRVLVMAERAIARIDTQLPQQDRAQLEALFGIELDK